MMKGYHLENGNRIVLDYDQDQFTGGIQDVVSVLRLNISSGRVDALIQDQSFRKSIETRQQLPQDDSSSAVYICHGGSAKLLFLSELYKGLESFGYTCIVEPVHSIDNNSDAKLCIDRCIAIVAVVSAGTSVSMKEQLAYASSMNKPVYPVSMIPSFMNEGKSQREDFQLV